MALSDDIVRVGFFLNWELDPVQRVWVGFGDRNIPTNALDQDVAGATYSGLGEIREIPALQSLVNGTADKVTFTMSGVSEAMLALASREAQSVKIKRFTIGIAEFDSEWQITDAGVLWIWTGWSDFVSLSRDGARGQTIQSVSVSVSTRFTRRRRGSFRYWTLAETKRRSPTDRFWDRTKLYEKGSTKIWPRFQPG